MLSDIVDIDGGMVVRDGEIEHMHNESGPTGMMGMQMTFYQSTEVKSVESSVSIYNTLVLLVSSSSSEGARLQK